MSRYRDRSSMWVPIPVFYREPTATLTRQRTPDVSGVYYSFSEGKPTSTLAFVPYQGPLGETRVNGYYGAPPHQVPEYGRLEGVLNGRILSGTWYTTTPSTTQLRGTFQLTFQPDGRAFDGWLTTEGSLVTSQWSGIKYQQLPQPENGPVSDAPGPGSVTGR